MNNEIINSLVELYKSRGVSLHDLLRDPLFSSLPVDKQIEAVNNYAGVIYEGGRGPASKRILTKSVISGTLGGLFASVPFMGKYTSGPTKLAIGLAAGIMGALTGALSGALINKSEKQRFERTNKYLIRLSKKPNTTAAVEVLDINRKYEPRTLSSIVRSLTSPEQALIEKAVGTAPSVKGVNDILQQVESKKQNSFLFEKD